MMKKLITIVLLALTVLIINHSLSGAEKSWYSYQEGMKLAKKEQKHIIIDFYADWCTWCRVMDKKTFSDPEVQEFLFDHFIPIKLNAESTTETIEFQG